MVLLDLHTFAMVLHGKIKIKSVQINIWSLQQVFCGNKTYYKPYLVGYALEKFNKLQRKTFVISSTPN